MKRILALILCFLMIPVMCVHSKDTELTVMPTVADAILGAKLQKNNFDKVEMGKTAGAVTVEKSGSQAWLLDKLQGDSKAYLELTLSDEFRSDEKCGDEFILDIEYFDEAKGYFKVNYNSYEGNKIAGMTYMKNEAEWKTASFRLQDAKFEKGITGPDVTICIKAKSTETPVSESSVAIRRVTLTKIPNKNPIYVSSGNDMPGNSYKWFEKSKIIHNKFENLTDKELSVDVEHKLVSIDGITVFEKNEKMNFQPKEVKAVDLDFGEVEFCDIYNYYVTIKNESENISSEFLPLEVIVLKTDPDGIKNKESYLAMHIDRYDENITKEAFEVFKLSNIYGSRMGVDWWEIEEVKGVLDWEKSRFVRKVEKLYRENNVAFIPIITFGSFAVTGMHNRMPKTEEQLQSYYNYVKLVATELGDMIDVYEIGNEPNLQHFNYDMDPGSVYAKLVEVATKAIHEVDPTAKISGYSVTGIASHGKDYFMEAVEAGAGENIDILALHPYISTEPEISTRFEDIQWFKDRYAEIGKPDPDILHSEVGYTIADEQVKNDYTKGIWNARTAILYKAKDLAEINVYYNFEKHGIVETDREDQFGMVNGADDEFIRYGKRFVPTIAYVFQTGYDYIMADSTAEEYLEPENGNIRICKFDSQKFGKKIVTLHSVKGQKNVTMNLGTEKVLVYDLKGNPTEVIGNDGVFTFTTNQEPIFIMGDITEMEVLENNDLVSFDKVSLSCVQNDAVRIDMTKNIPQKCSIDVDCVEKAEITEISEFDANGKGFITLWNTAALGENYGIKVRIKDEAGNIIQECRVSVEVAETVSTDLSVELISEKDVNRWRAVVDISNNSNTNAVSGYLKINSPSALSTDSEISIGNIPKGRTGRLEFNLPEIAKKSNYQVKYDIVLDDGRIYPFNQKIDFTLSKYAHTKPVIDGKIDKGEWDMNTAMYADSIDQRYALKKSWIYGGPEDLSGRIVVAWDEENFYLCGEVTDDIYYYNNPLVTSWNGDNIQIGVFYGEQSFLARGQAATTFHELSIANSTDGMGAYRNLSQDGVYEKGKCEDAVVCVGREGNKTIYEMSMPWKSLLRPDDPTPKEGDLLGFSYVINENDNTADGRLGWLEYASGIALSKNSGLFSYMTLIK